MPVVGVNRDLLFQKLGKSYTDEQFDELCFEYGIELDDVTSELEILQKEQAQKQQEITEGSDDVIYKIDIPANRYDMLCVEGIARALNVFKGTIPNPQYKVADVPVDKMERMVVKPEVALVRPFVVCALLKGITFDQKKYDSFIDLQDKLHGNLCKDRSLVAIGTHDYDTLKGPFSYEALLPNEIDFIALKQTNKMTADKLLEMYAANDRKLGKYVPLIQSSPVYPVIYDANHTVLSLPPIINGAHSAISLNTRNVFVECTATDLAKAKIVLNTVVCMFSEYCTDAYTVHPVAVQHLTGENTVYPDFSHRTFTAPVSLINKRISPKLNLTPKNVQALLNKMCLTVDDTSAGSGSDTVTVNVPPTRSDVLHVCDVIEDVAIAHGFNKLTYIDTTPTPTAGKELPLSQLTDLLRSECMGAGFTEILTWALLSHAENFENLRVTDSGKEAVELSNPATVEFQVVRSRLLGSALKTVAANKDAPLPLKLFEISDVVLLTEQSASGVRGDDVGAKNERRLVAVVSNKSAEFEVIHGLLDRVMEVLGVGHVTQLGAGGGYDWRESEVPWLFNGRQAEVLYNGKGVGHVGVVHPEVLNAFGITYPVSALEMTIEPFCFDQFYKPL